MPTHPLLQRFVDDELARTPSLAEQTLQGVFERLRTAPDRELINGLQQRGAVFRTAFADSLCERVTAEMARSDGGHGMAPPSGLGGLTLMDSSRVEIDIEISWATQLIDAAAEWELRELQTFTSALIGQAHVSAESNPLPPTVYAAALWDAGCAVFGQQGQQAALLRLAAPACAAHLKTAWAAASSRLERQGVTPSLFRTVILPPSSAAARPPALASASGLASTSASPTPGPMPPNALRRLLSAMPVERRAAGAVPPPPAAAPAAAAAAAAVADEPGQAHQVIALLAKVFDALLRDPQLHPAFVAPLARLQVSALRAAMREPSAVVDSPGYPMWALLDRFGEAGSTYPAAADPRAVALGKLFQRLAEELARSSAAPNADLFRKALDKLEEFLAAQLQAQLRAAQPAVDRLRQAESLQTLQEQLAQRLIEQMQPLRPSPAVRRFVTTTWSRVLATAMQQFGAEAPATHDAVALVDDLLWSVQTPDHPASRQRLAGLLPGLLQRLKAGMALIALPATEQQAILDELMQLHTAALRRGESASRGEPTATQIVHGIAADIERGSQAGGDPLDSAARGAAQDGTAASGGHLIDGASLETVPAELLPEGAAGAGGRSLQRLVDGLRPSQRLRIFINGRWARVQLLWRSDAGGCFLFASEAAGETHSVTRSALERLADAELLAPLESRTLMQRALASVGRPPRSAVAAAAAVVPTGAPA